MRKINFILLSILTFTIISCGGNGPKVLNEKAISKEEFGDKWPLTIEKGIIQCVQYEIDGVNPELMKGVILVDGEKTYGVNGTAKSQGKVLGYEDITTILSDDVKMKEEAMRLGASEKDATVKMDISPILDEGLKLCE